MIKVATMIIALVLLANPNPKEEQPELYQMHATAYVLTGITASGQETRQGICASGNREWIGKTIILYQRKEDDVGEIIGIYECLDTGCSKNVIDVWCDGMDEAQNFMNRVYEDGCAGKVFAQVIDAEG